MDKTEYNTYMKTYMREYSANRRLKALEILGNKCVVCGSTDKLEIDHIDPSTKSFTLASGWHHAWTKLVEELKKCQILCELHHIEKTAKEKSVEHGGGLTGKRNCRCDLCAPLKAKYQKRYK